MKLSQIFNLNNKTSISLKEVFHLRCISNAVFPMHIKMNINWDKLENIVTTFKAHKIEMPCNTYYTISLHNKNFFLVNYDKVLQSFSCYCNNKSDYEIMMNTFMIFSDYTYCEYYIDKDIEIDNYNYE
jgi:hypothetical protein